MDVVYDGPPLARSFAVSIWLEAVLYGKQLNVPVLYAAPLYSLQA